MFILIGFYLVVSLILGMAVIYEKVVNHGNEYQYTPFFTIIVESFFSALQWPWLAVLIIYGLIRSSKDEA